MTEQHTDRFTVRMSWLCSMEILLSKLTAPPEDSIYIYKGSSRFLSRVKAMQNMLLVTLEPLCKPWSQQKNLKYFSWICLNLKGYNNKIGCRLQKFHSLDCLNKNLTLAPFAGQVTELSSPFFFSNNVLSVLSIMCRTGTYNQYGCFVNLLIIFQINQFIILLKTCEKLVTKCSFVWLTIKELDLLNLLLQRIKKLMLPLEKLKPMALEQFC